MALGEFVAWMLLWGILAGAILYAGYAAYQADVARRATPPPRAGPAPLDEMRRINAELGRAAAESRQTLEAARETLRRGLRGAG